MSRELKALSLFTVSLTVDRGLYSIPTSGTQSLAMNPSGGGGGGGDAQESVRFEQTLNKLTA